MAATNIPPAYALEPEDEDYVSSLTLLCGQCHDRFGAMVVDHQDFRGPVDNIFKETVRKFNLHRNIYHYPKDGEGFASLAKVLPRRDRWLRAPIAKANLNTWFVKPRCASWK